ncbi:hypothetical protein [Coleofasciculus sp. F4-SAH-05]
MVRVKFRADAIFFDFSGFGEGQSLGQKQATSFVIRHSSFVYVRV